MAKKAAKKARKKSAAKRRKKSKAATGKRKARKARPKSLIGRAYRTVVDTVRGTGRLRNKMERPGSDETE